MIYFVLLQYLFAGFSSPKDPGLLNDSYQDKIIYTDFRPEYKKWKSGYIIDKIQYTETEMIFSFRYISTISGIVYFHGANTQSAWVLVNPSNPNQVFEHTKITDIYSNDIIRLKELKLPNVAFDTKRGDVFTCRVHFKKLPKEISRINFIEGKGMQNDPDHFNCFNIKIKSFSDELGNEDENKVTIKEFEKESDALFAKEFLRLMNKMRTEGCMCGNIKYSPAPKVKWNKSIAKASKMFVEHLWEENAMTTDDDGKSTVKRLKDVGYETKRAYENMSHGFENIRQAFLGWKNTPPQCIRMMDKNIKEIGAARKGKYWSLVMPLSKK